MVLYHGNNSSDDCFNTSVAVLQRSNSNKSIFYITVGKMYEGQVENYK